MDRIYAAGAAGAPPSVPGSPSSGYPTAGNPGTGTPATKPGAYWYHMIMEELMAIITAGGITPAPGTLNQVKRALDALYQPKAAPFSGQRNLVINGGCQVAQRSVITVNLSTTPTYGQVDQFACWATGTAVSAGTITQDSASPIGRTGAALKIAGATITGAGVVFARHRVSSKNAKRLKNQSASFSVLAHHDVGADVNYVITVRKPNSADNYGATTTIATGIAQAVPTSAGTVVSISNVALGDCSNGLEFEVQAQCGAVTTKNFSFTEFQIEEGSSVTSFDRRDYGIDMSLCREYLRAYSSTDGVIGIGGGYSTTAFLSSLSFDKPMRATPSLSGSASGTIYTFDGSGTQVAFSSVSLGVAPSPSAVSFTCNGSGITVNRGGVAQVTSGAIFLSAEL